MVFLELSDELITESDLYKDIVSSVYILFFLLRFITTP